MTNYIRQLAERLTKLESKITNASSTPQLGHSSIENGGAIKDRGPDGTTYQFIGRQFDGTHTVSQVNGPTPPAPGSVAATAQLGGMVVTWDGRFEDEVVAPMDLLRVDVHILDDEHADPLLYLPAGNLLAGSGGTVPVLLEPGTYYAKLVAWTTSGKYAISAASNEVVVTAPEVEIPDPTDGDPPAAVPAVTAKSIPGFVQLLWPAVVDPDLITGYHVYVGTSSGMAANAGTLQQVNGGTVALVRTLPDGTAMQPGTTYWFRVAAEDQDGVGPASPAVSATIGQQLTPDIATGAITASMLQSILVLASQFVGKDAPHLVVNKALTGNVATLTTESAHELLPGAKVSITGINSTFNGIHTVTSVPTTTTFTYSKTAANVASSAVVGGLVDPSQRWEADGDGIRFYDQGGVPVIVLPTNASPANPASFYGSLVAVGLIVLDNLSIQGLNNEVAAGGRLTLKSGVTAPSLAPTLSATYRARSAFVLTDTRLTEASEYGNAWDFDGGYWWLLTYCPTDSTMYLAQFDPAGGEPIAVTAMPEDYSEYPNQLVKIGNHVHAIVDDDGGRCLYWNLAALTDAVQTDSTSSGSIGKDQVNGRLVRCKASGSTRTITVRDASNYSSIISTHTMAATYSLVVDLVQADFGAPRFVMLDYNTNTARVYTTDATPVEQTDQQFPLDTNAWLPTWDGSRFVSRLPAELTGSRFVMREYSNITFPESQNRKWWVGTTWRKADATGPDYAEYETTLGKKSSVTMKKRAFLSVTHPNLPTAPADSVSFYLGASTTEPVNADMERQVVPAAGVNSMEYDTVTLTGANEPPSTNTFPGGTPSSLRSASGDLIIDALGHLTAPLKMQAGFVNITPTVANEWKSAAVLFPIAFDAVPIVVTDIDSSGTGNFMMESKHSGVTVTGFNAWLRSQSTTLRRVDWIALVP